VDRGANASMFFLHKKSGFALVEEGQIKILGESGGKGCMCINEWFKPIFPLFLTPKFDFAPPSPAPHPTSYGTSPAYSRYRLLQDVG